MAGDTRHIIIDKDSELGKALSSAGAWDEHVVIEVDGHTYDVAPRPPNDEDPWKGYDPERVRAALSKTAGSWADLDADKLIADTYRAREEGSRPADRP